MAGVNWWVADIHMERKVDPDVLFQRIIENDGLTEAAEYLSEWLQMGGFRPRKLQDLYDRAHLGATMCAYHDTVERAVDGDKSALIEAAKILRGPQ